MGTKSNLIRFPVPTKDEIRRSTIQRLGIFRRCPGPDCAVVVEGEQCCLTPDALCPECHQWRFKDFVTLMGVPTGEVVPLFPAPRMTWFVTCPGPTCGLRMSKFEARMTLLVMCPRCGVEPIKKFT